MAMSAALLCQTSLRQLARSVSHASLMSSRFGAGDLGGLLVGGRRGFLASSSSRLASASSSSSDEGFPPTLFESAELEALQKKFLRLSKPGASERALDLPAFETALRGLGFSDASSIAQLFRQFDENKNGTVDFREFAVNLSILLRGTDDERVSFVFKALDDDDDSKIDLPQYRSYLRANSVFEGAPNDKVFDSVVAHSYHYADRDADGLLTLGEFRHAVSQARLVLPSPLRGLTLGEDLTPGEQELISLLGESLTFQRGQEILHPNKEKCFFIVLNGSISTHPREHPSIVLEESSAPGAFIRQRSLFGGLPNRWLTVVRSETVQVLAIPNDEFLQLTYHSHPDATSLCTKLGNNMLQRFKSYEDVLRQHGILDDAFLAERDAITRRWSLAYHSLGSNGKLRVESSKEVGTAEELSVAYSPGVAEPCLAIKQDPATVYDYTCKGHLVGVITNGTAVLGLGNIGALASKPVMEGKACLFKKFAGLDSFDIEVNEPDPQRLIDVIVSLEPTFGGINIEDVKAPECFFIERECQKRMKICVMHDDQHGTSVIAGAGLLNSLEIAQKRIDDVRVVVCGVGAAGFTCAKYFRSLGVRPENITCVDKDGVVYKGRADLVANPDLYLHEVALDTDKRSLAEAIDGTDVFLGLSAGNLLKPALLKSMRRDPLVFALANPIPEISPPQARETRSDVIMATGRSDFPNQINNVLAFPYLFRGALDCRATTFNEDIKKACTFTIADIARSSPQFGREHIVPKPSDPRLLTELPPAVIQAAMNSGIASLPFSPEQMAAYRLTLEKEAARRK